MMLQCSDLHGGFIVDSAAVIILILFCLAMVAWDSLSNFDL